MVWVAALLVARPHAQQWPHYAGDQAASHYSPLDQITAANVGALQVAKGVTLPDRLGATGRGEETSLVALAIPRNAPGVVQ